ncbi:MAG TPA: BPSS1780 family membrane protein [Gallionella sp.]|nr:BPSS1780 family membrane protein [Gallionella sp.]
MEIRKLNAARGWIWVKQGYQLIMRNPLMSITFALIGALGMFAALKVPLFGPLIAILLTPMLMAGYMRICRALEEEEEIELTHLFEGFQKHAAHLVALGGFAMLGMLVASIAMIFIGGEALTKLLENLQSSSDPQMLAEAMWTASSGVAFSLLVGFTLAIVLMLALQYAPMLVFFSGLTPFAAMRASLVGSVRNLVPYTVYSIIMQVLALALGMLPFGIGLIVMLPLAFTSLYVSYRNIFPFADEIAANQPATPATGT